jgi:hypothetical protein
VLSVPGINYCDEVEEFDRPCRDGAVFSTPTQHFVLGYYQIVPGGTELSLDSNPVRQLPDTELLSARSLRDESQIAFWPRAISVAAGGNSTSCFADDRWLT